MKKCASCSKDLPDAALHCVFCGAKQASAPAPSAAAAQAKTVMGQFSASDMIQQLKQQGAVPPQPPAPAPPRPHTPSQPVPYAPPQAQPSPYAPPRPHTPSQPMPHPSALAAPPSMPAPVAPHGVPQAQAQAATMIAQAPPAGSFGPAAGGGGASASAWAPPPAAQASTMIAPAPASPLPASAFAPPPAAPSPPLHVEPAAIPPMPVSPYASARPAPRAGRPIEPWKDRLRMLMLIFGALTIAYLVVPRSMEPLAFGFQAILDAEGKGKIGPLLIAALGVLGVVFAFAPMPTATRGLSAGLLAVGVVVVPVILTGLDTDLPWQVLAQVGAMLFLLPGLVLRSQYRDAMLPRVLVTVGVLAYLATMLVPVGDQLPLIRFIEMLIDGNTSAKIAAAAQLAQVIAVVLSLLVWLPAPGTGGAMIWAWFLMLFPLVMHVVGIVLDDRVEIAAALTAVPGKLLLDWAPASAAFVFLGYGWASVFGKQLE